MFFYRCFLQEKTTVYVQREQICFSQFAAIEFHDFKFAEKLVKDWNEKSKKGESHFEGVTNEKRQAAKREATFWYYVQECATENMLKKIQNWDSKMSNFIFVLHNSNEWEALEYLRKKGFWKGPQVKISQTTPKKDLNSIPKDPNQLPGMKIIHPVTHPGRTRKGKKKRM